MRYAIVLLLLLPVGCADLRVYEKPNSTTDEMHRAVFACWQGGAHAKQAEIDCMRQGGWVYR